MRFTFPRYGEETSRGKFQEGCWECKGISSELSAILNIDNNLTDSFKKAEAANQKVAAENAKKAVTEDQEWSKGAKSNAKKFVLFLPLLLLVCLHSVSF